MWQWNDETKRETADYMESWLKKEGWRGSTWVAWKVLKAVHNKRTSDQLYKI